jgi:nucleotide-binding universal stress UspA family protein
MIHRVLAAVDASPRAARVLGAAQQLALRFSAELTVLRVVFVPPEFPPAAAAAEDMLGIYLLRDAERGLSELLAATNLPLPTTLLAREGHPVQTILEVAATIRADVIVLGSHGYHGLDRLLGTTTAKIANLAHTNVFIVHGTEDRK